MVSETKAIEIINKYLKRAQESDLRQYFPVVASAYHTAHTGKHRRCDTMELVGKIPKPFMSLELSNISEFA